MAKACIIQVESKEYKNIIMEEQNFVVVHRDQDFEVNEILTIEEKSHLTLKPTGSYVFAYVSCIMYGDGLRIASKYCVISFSFSSHRDLIF